ncbi:MAG: MMPL family transporter [Deltaproteobacteria bacterium]
MKRYLAWVLAHRGAVLLLMFAVTGVAAYSLTNAVFASSVIKLFFGDSPDYVAYRELADEFVGNDVMVFAFEDPELFTPEGAQRLESVVEGLRELDFIKRVDSLASAVRISSEGDELLIDRYLDLTETMDADALVDALRKDPLTSGWLISHKSKATAMLLELTPDPDRPIERIPSMLAEVMSKFEEAGIAPETIHRAGIVVESTEATEQARFTLSRLFPVTVLLLAFVVFVLFLRVWPVIITGGVALIAIVWTFGLAVAIDPEVNLLMAMVPGMITVIAFSDIIHLYSGFVRMCQFGIDKRDAVLESGAEVGVACLFTSITTFVGFASLIFIPTPVIRHLGVVLGAGVGIALLLALTLVPIALSWVPGIEAGTRGESRLAQRWLDALLSWSQRISMGWPKATVAFFAIVIAVCGYGASQLTIESSFAKRLDPDNEIRRSQRYISDNFSGANFLDVYVLAPEGKDVLDPEAFAGVAKLHEMIEAQPEVDDALSLVDTIRAMHGALTDESELPGTRELLAQYLLLFEISGGEGLSQLINEPRSRLRLSVRLKEDGLRGLAAFGDRLKAKGEVLLPEGYTVKPTGITYLLGDWITFTLDGQRRGLLFAVFSTALMMIICLRSLRVGLLSMIPNLLPLVVLGGYVGGVWDQVDSDTILVAVFAIGIAVDDTIHFLTRLRIESERAPDIDTAVAGTFSFTGRAIIQTTVILCIGFSPFAFSDYFSTQIIGTLLPMCLFVALIADLFLVPALVKLGVLRFASRAA